MTTTDREAIADRSNPLGIEGIEFIEYSTAKPQALGHVLELIGFRPVARHRSREVLLYRQGGMNIVVNAHGATAESPAIAALALRVRDAGAAFAHAIERGAWAVPTQVQPMELHIPGVHGVGASRIFFVDRWREFSIYDVDFVPIPTVDPKPPAIGGLHWFGVVQYIGADRMEDWSEFYRELFGFTALPDEQRFGVMPKGRVLRSPCGSFYLQLIEPELDALESAGDEVLHRVGLGAADVPAAVHEWQARGVQFVESAIVKSNARGAITQPVLGGVTFELVHSEL